MKLVRRVCGLGLLVLLAAGLPAVSQIRQRRYPGQTGPGDTPDLPLATFIGSVTDVDKKSLTLQSEESNTLKFACTHKTHYFDGDKKLKSSDIKPGDRVLIETKRFADGELEAINVRIQHEKTPNAEAKKTS
jgi:hypothetical protein